jgi:hypothetical protein
MTWTLTASGHCDDADAEAALIDALTGTTSTDAYGCTSAMLGTQHHGRVDLLSDAGQPAPEPEVE